MATAGYAGASGRSTYQTHAGYPQGYQAPVPQESPTAGPAPTSSSKGKGDRTFVTIVAVVLAGAVIVGALGLIAIVNRGSGLGPEWDAILAGAKTDGVTMKLDSNKDGVYDKQSELDRQTRDPVKVMDADSNNDPDYSSDTTDTFVSEAKAKAEARNPAERASQVGEEKLPEQNSWAPAEYHETRYDQAADSESDGVAGAGGAEVIGETLAVEPTSENYGGTPKIELPVDPKAGETGGIGATDVWLEPPAKAKEAGDKFGPDAYGDLLGEGMKLREDKDCTKTEKLDTKDTDGDGKVDWAHYMALVSCSKDLDNDGFKEYRLEVAIDATATDPEEDNKLNTLDGTIGARESIDVNKDGTDEYVGTGGFTGAIKDTTPNDGNWESVIADLNIHQKVDMDQGGNDEFVREIHAHLEAYDNSSNGKMDFANGVVDGEQKWDNGDDGSYEYRGALHFDITAADPSDDGNVDTASITLWGYELYDGNLDGNAELARGIAATLKGEDPTGAKRITHVDGKLAGFAAQDNNSNGIPERGGVILASYVGADNNADGSMDDNLLEALGAVAEDMNEDRNPEKAAFVALKGESTDADKDGKPEHAYLAAAGLAYLDANSDGTAEEAIAAAGIFDVVDASEDGNPEQLSFAMWAHHYKDSDQDGNYEVEHAFVAGAQVNDSDSDGTFEEARFALAGYKGLDPDDNGVRNYEGALVFGGKATDANDDGNPESVHFGLWAGEYEDANEDGNKEMVRAFAAESVKNDTNSNGNAETNTTRAAYYEELDANSDGQADSIHAKLLEIVETDANDDGTVDSTSVRVWEYKWP